MKEQSSGAQMTEVWASGEAYEPFVGRWSRIVARKFLEWLAVPAEGRWLDVGCGTGALTRTILKTAEPRSVTGVDAAEAYLAHAGSSISDKRAGFLQGDARALPVKSDSYDAVVSGLMLNFIAEPVKAVREMARAASSGGHVAAYVWDYAGRMQLMRHFWNAAARLDPLASALDEGKRFPLCSPGALTELFVSSGLAGVEVMPIDVWTEFRDFEDFWEPFLGGQGPAPGYVMSLDEERRTELRERLRVSLPYAVDGSIPLIARAWAVRGIP